MKPTTSEGLRWLVDHVGSALDTVQVRESTGNVWQPGPRTLVRKGNRFALDDSLISWTPNHKLIAVDETSLTMVWLDEVGDVIHTTTYKETTA
jgi:hypothetical protein